MSSSKPSSGKGYEKIVADIYRQFAGLAEVIENEHVVGKSGRTRQIDVSLRTEVAGHPLHVIIECKDYARPVGIDKVDELIGKVDDVKAAMGVLVSDSGFGAGAVERAKFSDKIQLVSVLDPENPLLRARIKTAVSVAFYELEKISFSIVGETSMNNAEMMTVFEQEGAKISNAFYDWYDENGPEIEAGFHEYKQTFYSQSGRQITAICSFKQSIRVFFSENVWNKGAGIYDVVKGEVIKGDSLKHIVLDFPYIKVNWRETTGHETEEKINVSYKLLPTFGRQ